MRLLLKLLFAFGLPAAVITLCLRYPDVLAKMPLWHFSVLRVLDGVSWHR